MEQNGKLQELVNTLRLRLPTIKGKEMRLYDDELTATATECLKMIFQSSDREENTQSDTITTNPANLCIAINGDRMMVESVEWSKDRISGKYICYPEVNCTCVTPNEPIHPYKSSFYVGELIPIEKCWFAIWLYDFLNDPQRRKATHTIDFGEKYDKEYARELIEEEDTIPDTSSLIGKTVKHTLWMPAERPEDGAVSIGRITRVNGPMIETDGNNLIWSTISDIQDLIEKGTVTNTRSLPFEKMEIL